MSLCGSRYVFLRADECLGKQARTNMLWLQDPAIHKATGETEPVSVMAKLREMKNNFK